MDENWCFYCQDKGHRAARCSKKPNTWKTPNNPFTAPKDTNPFHAHAASLEEQSNTSMTNKTIISQPASFKKWAINYFKGLSKEERNDVLNNMMINEDF